MAVSHKRNPLVPWLIGLPIVLVAVGHGAVPVTSESLVLGVLPLIYLILRYLTLRSQD